MDKILERCRSVSSRRERAELLRSWLYGSICGGFREVFRFGVLINYYWKRFAGGKDCRPVLCECSRGAYL
jgi:hypothetical protein